MAVADIKYKELIRKIMKEGVWDKDQGVDIRPKYKDGTPAYSKKIFGHQVTFEKGEVPIVTSSKVFTKTAIKEMLLFWVHQFLLVYLSNYIFQITLMVMDYTFHSLTQLLLYYLH